MTLACASGHGEQTAKRSLTVADAIETTRFMRSAYSAAPNAATDGVFVSTDGKRYAVMLIRGDLKRPEGAGNWVEILAGRLDSIDGAKPRSVARLFTQSLGSPDPIFSVPFVTWPQRNPLVWLPDNERVAFFWPDDKDVVQVAALNVNTGELAYLSQAERDVTSFHLAPSGAVLYSALFAHPRDASEQLLRDGFVVRNDADLLDVIRGDVDGYGMFERSNNTRWYIAGPGGPPRRLSSSGDSDRSAPLFPPVFSADGRRALMGHYPASVPPEWSRYTERAISTRMAAWKTNPDALTARYIKQLFVVELETGEMRPLWSAPAELGLQAAWSPDGRSVLLGPTMLPLDGADEAGLAGRAIAVVDVESGKFSEVKLPAEDATRPLRSLRWLSSDRLELVQASSTFRFQRGPQSPGGWEQEEKQEDKAPLSAARRLRASYSAPVSVQWRQSTETPPVLYAIDTRSKRERAVLDPNPNLTKRFELGRVEFITWKDRKGRDWRGRLYHPTRAKRGERVPLVIQTHGFSPPGEFSLYGNGSGTGGLGEPGLGPGFSVYAAQPLASKGIAVLTIEDLSGPLVRLTSTPEEAEALMRAYETAVEHLATRGLIDPAKVGIAGFSRTGWHVAYALTHSSFRFAAAIISDSFMGDYIPVAVGGWGADYTRNVGAEPFGEGLRLWLERAPAFNVEKLQTPLRIQVESSGLTNVISKWELYSRARYLKKPVELFVIPNVERGSHGIQNPLQCLAAQQGAVNWFESWLLHGRAPDPGSLSQAPTQQ